MSQFNVFEFRSHFPMLDGKKMQNEPLVFLDNASTTFKPIEVFDAIRQYYFEHTSNSHRGDYDLCYEMDQKVYETRTKVAQFINARKPEEIVFTSGASMSLNIIAYGLMNEINEGDEIIIDEAEHASNVLPWFRVAELKGAKIKYIPLSQEGRILASNLKQVITNKTKVVSVAHVTNVLGFISESKEMAAICHTFGAYFVLDGAQSVPHMKTDVIDLDCDFLVFSAHKMYGPTGLSGFVMNPEIDLDSILFGGTGFDSANQDMPNQIPERYEMGTLNILGIAGLHAALEWIKEVGISSLLKKELEHRQRLIELLGKYDFMKIIGGTDGDYVGIISAIMPGFSSDSAGLIFNERNIEIRSGLQCAPIAHKFIGTYPAGTLRFSTSFFTSDSDFEELEIALNDIQGNL